MLRCVTSVDLRDLTRNPSMPSYTDRSDGGSVAMMKNERPLLVTLSAKAIGSMGLGLSILAIWLRWIVPQKAEEPKPIPKLPARKRLRRRHRLSAPSRVQTSSSRPPITNGNPSQDENRRSRRVYFEDEERPSPPSPKVELKPILETSSDSGEEKSPVTVSSADPELSVPVVHLLLKRETYEDSIAESETSSRRSSLCQLPKIKSPFTSKARRRSASPDSLTRLQDAELGFEKPKRASTFTSPWSSSRKGKPTVTLTDETTSVKSFTPLSPFRRSSGSRSNSIDSASSSCTPCTKPKPSRHASTPAPIRRTQPYEAPYFATPPIAFQSRNDHDTRATPSITKESRGRPSTAQTLPVNRTRAIAKQRSSSLDITVRM